MLTDPLEIEKKSFEIIENELGNIKILEESKPVVYRVIHATADFEYSGLIEIHHAAYNAWFNEMGKGVLIYADTKMIVSGVDKIKLKKNKFRIYTLVDDSKVKSLAKKNNSTRAIASIDMACNDKKTKIFVIGNSPTALFRLKELINDKKISPSLIIGVPVGFVGAAESKDEIKKLGIPYIITNGRKGGSTVAVAIVNALLKMAE